MRLLLLLLLINCSYSQNSDFDEANMLYNEGRYIDAIDVYNKILDSGLHSSDLYFNIGNSYYKIGEIAEATPEEINSSIEVSEKAQKRWWNLSSLERANLMHKVADKMVTMKPICEPLNWVTSEC